MKTQFIEALRVLPFPELAVTETEEGVDITISPLSEAARKGVVDLYNKYIGFWRSIAIDVKHEREPKKAHWFIKNHLITGKDLTEDQFLEVTRNVTRNVSKSLIVPQ